MHPARRGCGKDVCVTFRGDQHTVEVVVDVIGVGCQKNPCSGAAWKYRANMALAGSLRGAAGRYAAIRWAVVQLDLDERGAMYGTMLVQHEVPRTIKRVAMRA